MNRDEATELQHQLLRGWNSLHRAYVLADKHKAPKIKKACQAALTKIEPHLDVRFDPEEETKR